MKVEFVLLTLLTAMAVNDESWMQDVQNADATHGYGIAYDDDSGEAETHEFASDELEFVSGVQMYNILGSEHCGTSFYERDEQVYKDKATGRYWVMNSDEIDVC